MYIDRGMKKWRGMMIPEHVELLKKWREEEEVEKPILDEQKLQEFEEIVQEALEYHRILVFTAIVQEKVQTITGYVHYFDAMKKVFKIIDESDTVYSLPVTTIINIYFAEK